jgi:hypothetical protein
VIEAMPRATLIRQKIVLSLKALMARTDWDVILRILSIGIALLFSNLPLPLFKKEGEI